MEALLIYIVKSSGLLAGFFLIYYLLLRRDTFFNLSRWYLLGGLIISLLLPLYVIKKTVIVERAPLTIQDVVAMAAPQSQLEPQQPTEKNIPLDAEAAATPIDWFEVAIYGYALIAAVMFMGVLVNFVSLFRLLYKKEVIRRDRLKLIDLDKNVAPFSFFKYIVFNSRLYTGPELSSILNHEKVHSEQHHTADILLAKLVCIVFWFNPFVWLYKKAIAQNLEYIADRQAIRRTHDKKAYQIALLKVGATTNTFSITNPFYQSLIKKRIVMLNKNESKRSNLLKYALVFPLLAAFMLYFQVKVVAQTKDSIATTAPRVAVKVLEGTPVVISKNTSDAELKRKAAKLKEEGVTMKVSKVKRNKSGEITGIKVECKDKDGNKSVSHVNGKEPIKPIRLNGGSFAPFNNSNVHVYNMKDLESLKNLESLSGLSSLSELESLKDLDFDFDFDYEVIEDAEAPEVPAAPAPPGELSAPAVPGAPSGPNIKSKKIIIRNGSKAGGSSGFTYSTQDSEPMVIVNGKILKHGKKYMSAIDPNSIKSMDVLKGDSAIKMYGAGGKDGVIVINTEDIEEMKNSAMKIAKAAMNKASKEMTESDIDLVQAKIEMQKAKEEMQAAKAEMEKAKAEFEKAKAELKKGKN